MNFKKVHKQVNEFALKLPLTLCQVKPENISLKEVASFQQVISKSANILENVNNVLNLLLEERQGLLNQINEYKGEQGTPIIRPQVNSESQNTNENSLTEDNSEIYCNKSRNISSEKQRIFENTTKSRRTNKDIEIHEVKKITVDKSILPVDAIFKGYKTYTVQDIKFYPWNTLYKLEEYYSPSQCKSYIAQTPVNVKGSAFGNDTKTLIITLNHQANVSQPSIYKFLTSTIGLQISPSTISRILTDNLYKLEQEKQEIVEAGLAVSTYIQMDDTSARVNGVNYYSHILCSDSFISYFTEKNKDRLTLLKILSQDNIMHTFNDNTFKLLSYMSISNRVQNAIKEDLKLTMSTEELKDILSLNLGDKNIHAQKQILEASAIISYQQSQNAVKILVCDEAPQFKLITEILSLCWVHVGRHFKKLNPILPVNQLKTDEFISKFWEYYHKLLNYKNNPDTYLQLVLWIAFDELFSTKTGFDELDERIAKTKTLKKKLLVVLDHPYVPLHNNHSELAARAQARKRDVSLQNINEKGVKAKDAWMTIIKTSVLHKINVYAYVKDMFNEVRNMSLAKIIKDLKVYNTT